MASSEDLKHLYNKEYLKRFQQQSGRRLDRLLRLIPLQSTDIVADFGCGDGMMSGHVGHRVKSYFGVDFSQEFITAAESRIQQLNAENVQFFCSDIIDFCHNYQDMFDVAFAMDFSEHVYDTEWIEILESIALSLKHNGRLYLHTPNADFFVEIMKKNNFILKQFPEHVAVRTAEHNVALLIKAGFTIRTIRLLSHYGSLRFLHGFSFIPVVGKYFKARIFIEACK